MNTFTEQIKKAIAAGLPGIEAQLKLAPESRKLFPENNKKKIDAAILILLFKDNNDRISTVLMKRQAYNGPHSAQISFPGGKAETSDSSLKYTALRESEEEIGIKSENVEVVGKLTKLYIPVSNFLVHPYIGILNSKPNFIIDKIEVEYLITFPIKNLIYHPISIAKMEYKGDNFNVPYYKIRNEMIWGATAMILSEFIDVIKKLPNY